MGKGEDRAGGLIRWLSLAEPRNRSRALGGRQQLSRRFISQERRGRAQPDPMGPASPRAAPRGHRDAQQNASLMVTHTRRKRKRLAEHGLKRLSPIGARQSGSKTPFSMLRHELLIWEQSQPLPMNRWAGSKLGAECGTRQPESARRRSVDPAPSAESVTRIDAACDSLRGAGSTHRASHTQRWC